jgi:hypothetical protein
MQQHASIVLSIYSTTFLLNISLTLFVSFHHLKTVISTGDEPIHGGTCKTWPITIIVQLFLALYKGHNSQFLGWGALTAQHINYF